MDKIFIFESFATLLTFAIIKRPSAATPLLLSLLTGRKSNKI